MTDKFIRIFIMKDNETNNFTSEDIRFMNLALSEAARGLGFTSPNPMVGAVIVKDNKILSVGYHHQVGLPHAERDAIMEAVSNGNELELRGSTMYVTLEPCCHQGRTPPCTDAIIESGIARVVVASLDADSRVSGKGIEQLRNAGIRVEVGLLDDQNKQLNSVYFFWKLNKRPYITMKAALSLDGKIATSTDDSYWISNDESRKLTHKFRARLKAIAVGKNTVIHDRPKLNCRLDDLQLGYKPTDKLIFAEPDESLTSSFADNPGRVFFIDKKISSSAETFIDFCNQNEIDSVLVEGGSGVYTWFLQNGLVDRVVLFYRPTFIGDDGKNVVKNLNVTQIRQLQDFSIVKSEVIDDNIMIDMYRQTSMQGEPLCLLDW